MLCAQNNKEDPAHPHSSSDGSAQRANIRPNLLTRSPPPLKKKEINSVTPVLEAANLCCRNWSSCLAFLPRDPSTCIPSNLFRSIMNKKNNK